MSSTNSNVIKASVYHAKVWTFNKWNVLRLQREFCERYGIDESVQFEITPTDGGFLFTIRRISQI
jgi:hypothetical protein